MEQLYVFLFDIASLQSLCHYVLIVGQSNQLYVSSNKSTLGDGTSSYSGYSISLRELLQDSVNELKLYIIAEFWNERVLRLSQ